MRPRAGFFAVLAASAAVFLAVVAPPGAIRFLLRSPIVLAADVLSAIWHAFAPVASQLAVTDAPATGQVPAGGTPIIPSIGSFAGLPASTSEAAPQGRSPSGTIRPPILPGPNPVPENPVTPPVEPLPSPDDILPPPEQVLDPVEEIVDPVVDPIKETLDPILGPVEKAAEPVVNTVEKAAEPAVNTVEKAAEPVVDTAEKATEPVVDTVKDVLDKIGAP